MASTQASKPAWLGPTSRILLGSSSKSRRGIMDELAAELGFSYECASADIDEQAIRHEDPHQLVRQLAAAKADAIASRLASQGTAPSGLLITCDQVVVHRDRILEKPRDEAEARVFIRGYASAPASTVGSVMVTDLETRASACAVDVTTIEFSAIPEASIEALIEEGEVFWCAGGLMVEHALVAPHIVRMEGGMDAVMGLSKATTLRLLQQAAQR
ncbi:Maf-like protein [Auxenochlorella protothecoides]|nr:Maf-like protein [Auxenochlorella protothecoides]KFM24175.1 Maf-like protein [Auxenochlorella protothecoides]RMZ53906.1 hypothetical protein APUTEX25_004749 [Auxenochlorella protothecoides]|eukprot:RMZ53906.1 hypothetical protein APUTEX25_004749 [Auxenochlorella protothecoides]